MYRRSFLIASAAALASGVVRNVAAQTYPARSVTLWVPYAVGGNGDLTARLFAEVLGTALGQPVVVGNKPGGGGAIGAMHVIGSAPDGYNLLFSAPSVFSVAPHLTKAGYGVSSIQPICLVSRTPLVLVVKKGSRLTSLTDVVQAAQANPGGVSMGYGGLGTPNHLAMLDLEAVAQVRFNGIAYKGSSPMLQDMLAGQIEIAADQISTSRPYIESGALVPLAVFGPEQASLPGIPSVASLGPEPFDVTTYLGMAGPKQLPDSILQVLQRAAADAAKSTRFADGMSKMGSFVYWASAQEYANAMRKEDEFIRALVSSGRIKTDS